MSKFKAINSDVPKYSTSSQSSCGISSPRIIVSFAHVTENKDYNFNYFKNNRARDNLDARKELDKLLASMTSKTWREAGELRKTDLGGYEIIPFDQFKSIQIKHMSVAKDTPIYIFRFNSQQYRLCGIKEKKCNVLHIIAYDFDHSLYNHGS